MINHLKGKLVEKTPTYAVIECNGVGYYLHISLNTYSKLPNDENVMLYAHMAVREDAHTLYGFIDKDERQLFLYLISVSGVGSSTARMILSSLNAGEIQRAIVEGDVALLKSVKGIGTKSAERIIIDLRDKLKKENFDSEIGVTANNSITDEALSALVALGFAKNVAEKVIAKTAKGLESDVSVEELIKTALKNL
ncbi:MAG: Holliday junction branch migration protein RuvA [Flavobacteriales bacterium]|nr:Holliday junction branch migration protein RuvA [Flavobacteriales bacterium]